MKIIRVLNTNAVVSVDGENREVIITGPGIGFKKKKGEHLDESLIDKTYCLQSKESSHRLQEVVKAISEQYLEIAARVVRAARTEQGLKVNDILYVTLTDHIHSAVERSPGTAAPPPPPRPHPPWTPPPSRTIWCPS